MKFIKEISIEKHDKNAQLTIKKIKKEMFCIYYNNYNIKRKKISKYNHFYITILSIIVKHLNFLNYYFPNFRKINEIDFAVREKIYRKCYFLGVSCMVSISVWPRFAEKLPRNYLPKD